MEEFKSILLDLQLKLGSIINRIPDVGSLDTPASRRSMSFSSRSPVETRSSDTELPGEGPNGCPEQYHSPVLVAFHKWARILLSLFIDKAYCVAYQPFLKNAKSRIWPAARQRYGRWTGIGLGWANFNQCTSSLSWFYGEVHIAGFGPRLSAVSMELAWVSSLCLTSSCANCDSNHQPMHATM